MPCLFTRAVIIVAIVAGTMISRCDESVAALADANNPLVEQFKSLDADGDGLLTQDEYLKRSGREAVLLPRDFLVFDTDGDKRLSRNEFLTIPVGQPEDQRGTIFDPVIQLAESRLADLTAQWKGWDKNDDGKLDATEFQAAEIAKRLHLESIPFEAWDANHDGQLSQDELTRDVKMAYGVITPEGEPLRAGSGRVVDWIMFRNLKKNERGMVTRDEYNKAPGIAPEAREQWFRGIDKNGDGQFGFTEFSQGEHRTDPVGTFLHLDRDLNGKLSPDELKQLPEGWRQMAQRAMAGFDDDHDGSLSLREYQMLPHCNLLVAWNTAADSNGDGVISADEFHFLPGLQVVALTAEYFRRLDLNHDNVLTMNEWGYHTAHPSAKFSAIDKNRDGWLSSTEFADEGSLPAKRLNRDFLLLDVNHDGKLVLAEYLAMPGMVPNEHRINPDDPIKSLVDVASEKILTQFDQADQNGDGTLNEDEFTAGKISSIIAGLEATALADWDMNQDQKISREDVARFLQLAYGTRSVNGDLLRYQSGQVVDWRMYANLKKDADGFVTREVYFAALGPITDAEKEKWYAPIDQNHDNKFDFAEFVQGNHRTDPVANFMELDKNLDGKLSPAEIAGLPRDRFPLAHHLFPGFDEDGDGFLSLREFQFTPAVNLLIYCQSLRDTNGNGTLEPDEFRFQSGFAFAALGAEYFKRFDTDHDNVLSLDEFTFSTDSSDANVTQINVVSPDNSVSVITIPDYPIICSPEISPDGKWVAVDGWKHGQSNAAAHLLIASVESDDVRDLGMGCIPHWSADGRKIAYSKYNFGVFIRDVDADPDDEESIDRRGWAIHFSTDGKSVAFIENGNIVVMDLDTRNKKYLFPKGKSSYSHIEHNFCWSPDSKRICFKGHRENGAVEVGIVETTGDEPKLRVRCDGREVQSDFAWLADRDRIMFPRIVAGQKTQLYEIDPDGQAEATRYPRQSRTRNNGGMCWSRDGKTLVFMSTR